MSDDAFFDESYLSGDCLTAKYTINNKNSEIFCAKFSPDGEFICVGCGNGAIKAFSTINGSQAFELQPGTLIALPTTALRFRPDPSAGQTKTKNVLITVNASGIIQHWHLTSGKCIHSITENGNSIYALDYNYEGTHFATGGKDHTVRLYDETTKALVSDMSGSAYSTKPGHTNRIFCLKFVPDDPNVLLSTGWDNTVVYWDVRTGSSVKSFYGAHICGDALDIDNHEIVTGSYRSEHQLELWDYGKGTKITDIKWDKISGGIDGTNSSSSMLYTAQFSKNNHGRLICAGGSNANEAKLFDHHDNNKIIASITGLSRAIFAVDFLSDSSKMLLAGGDSCIRVYDVKL